MPWRRVWQPTPVFLPGESMDRGAWKATVHVVSESQTRLSNFTFIKSHSLSSICGRKVTGDEGHNGDELELRQVPEGWKWVIVQNVRW